MFQDQRRGCSTDKLAAWTLLDAIIVLRMVVSSAPARSR